MYRERSNYLTYVVALGSDMYIYIASAEVMIVVNE